MRSLKLFVGLCSICILGTAITASAASAVPTETQIRSFRRLPSVFSDRDQEEADLATPANASDNLETDPRYEPIDPEFVPEYGDQSSFGHQVKSDGTVIITSYQGNLQDLVVPGQIDGRPVSEIGASAFKGAHFQSVVLPDSIKKIAESGFQACSYMVTIELGSGVEEIGSKAFTECYSLETVVMGDQVRLIDSEAFAGCAVLLNISFPQSLERIGKNAFAECYCLTAVELPDSLKYIGAGSFRNCVNLAVFTIPANVIEVQLNNQENLTGSIKIINNSNLQIPVAGLSFIGAGQKGTGWYDQESGGTEVSVLMPGATIFRQFTVNYYMMGTDNGGNPYHIGINDEVVLKPLPEIQVGNYKHTFEGWYFDRQYQDKAEVLYGSSQWVQDVYAKQTATYVGGSGTGGGGSSGGGGGGSSSGGGGGGGSSSSGGPRGTGASTQPTSYQANTNPDLTITDETAILEGSWIQQDSQWRFKDNAGNDISSRWITLNDKSYFIGADGIMVTGWQKINEKWYLFDLDGARIIGWKYVNYKWYFMKEDGVMATGWILVNGKHYYLDQSGILLTSTTTPDGYSVNSNGEWIQ